jgi:hypothetical protein
VTFAAGPCACRHHAHISTAQSRRMRFIVQCMLHRRIPVLSSDSLQSRLEDAAFQHTARVTARECCKQPGLYRHGIVFVLLQGCMMMSRMHPSAPPLGSTPPRPFASASGHPRSPPCQHYFLGSSLTSSRSPSPGGFSLGLPAGMGSGRRSVQACTRVRVKLMRLLRNTLRRIGASTTVQEDG